MKKIPYLAILMCMLVLTLSACQSTRNLSKDCKIGDWQVIGQKDGSSGFVSKYAERREFCSGVDGAIIPADSSSQYALGWEKGNANFWFALGKTDGLKPLPSTLFNERLKDEKIVEKKTPPNQTAYQSGWTSGNAQYWREVGVQDGLAGQTQEMRSLRAQEGANVGFAEQSWREGWAEGNYGYWRQAGYQDAHDGIPDTAFIARKEKARQVNLTVREDAYRDAWEKELIEYWRRTATNDATTGRDLHTRRAESAQRGLKFLESVYQESWTQRVKKYWAEAGEQDGWGNPHRLEERMARARQDQIFVIAETRAIYEGSYRTANARYCTIDNAFQWGREMRSMNVYVCNLDIRARIDFALNSGATYQRLEREQAALEDERRSLIHRVEGLRKRLASLEAEIRRDKDDKNRQPNQTNKEIDQRREREQQELIHAIREGDRRINRLYQDISSIEMRQRHIKNDVFR